MNLSISIFLSHNHNNTQTALLLSSNLIIFLNYLDFFLHFIFLFNTRANYEGNKIKSNNLEQMPFLTINSVKTLIIFKEIEDNIVQSSNWTNTYERRGKPLE